MAIDSDTKLVITYHIGGRTADDGNAFMMDLARRLTARVQLTTDGFHPYREAVGMGFRGDVDYAQLVKRFGPEDAGAGRYSPPRCIGVSIRIIRGQPDEALVSTSYVERQNLTMRMNMRRFTRLTNAFSKRIDNLEAAIALHFFHYNFVRRHMTLRVSPAMAAGVERRLWSFGELAELIG